MNASSRGLGIDPTATRVWRNGSNQWGTDGKGPICGTGSQWLNGQDGPGHAFFTPAGERTCCSTVHYPTLLAAGGVELNGAEPQPSCATAFDGFSYCDMLLPNGRKISCRFIGGATFRSDTQPTPYGPGTYGMGCGMTTGHAVPSFFAQPYPPASSPVSLDFVSMRFQVRTQDALYFPLGSTILYDNFRTVGFNGYLEAKGGSRANGNSSFGHILPGHRLTASGGAVLSGGAVFSLHREPVLFSATGGLLSGGAGVLLPAAIREFQSTGGSVSDGLSSFDREGVLLPAGGILSGGAAVFAPHLVPMLSGLGGATADGTSLLSSFHPSALAASGGALIGGAAATIRWGSTPARYAGTVIDNSAIGSVAWTNPGNAAGAPGSSSATWSALRASSTTPNFGHYLLATNFSFVIADIPDGATIRGIIVGFTCEYDSAGSSTVAFENSIRIYNGGFTGTDKSGGAALPFGPALATYGNAGDVWGTSLTPANVRSSNFGFGISLKTATASLTRYGNLARGMVMQVFWQK